MTHKKRIQVPPLAQLKAAQTGAVVRARGRSVREFPFSTVGKTLHGYAFRQRPTQVEAIDSTNTIAGLAASFQHRPYRHLAR